MNTPTETREPDADGLCIRDILNGDRNAFKYLVEKYQSKFLGMACRILGSRAEAEDVLQDALIQAYSHLPDFQNKARFSTWLYSIVLNHIRNHLRHRRVLSWIPLDGHPDHDDYRPPDIAEKSPSPDLIVEQKLQMEMIHKTISSFPPQYQSVFVLHYFQNLPLKEVAERLNRPLGTVKAYLHRTRKLLTKSLSQQTHPKPSVSSPPGGGVLGNERESVELAEGCNGY
jgi:RNA polymerase sigma-70 factor (ECF subfamily)